MPGEGFSAMLHWKCVAFDRKQATGQRLEKTRAYAAAVIVVIIWSGWFTVSRFGVQTSLTPADITLLRFATALAIVLPLVFHHKWQLSKIHQYLTVGLGVGFPYTLCSFYGMTKIPVGHAGVLINGSLPLMSSLAVFILLGKRLKRLQVGAIGLTVIANVMMAGEGVLRLEHLQGIGLLLSAAVVYTLHMMGIRLWQFDWKKTLVTVPVVNTILFLPLWLFLPSSGFSGPWTGIVLQMFYQGFVVNVVALCCVAYALKYIPLVTMSVFMSAVPVAAAMLAWLFLGEQLSYVEGGGIVVCSLGLYLYSRANEKT